MVSNSRSLTPAVIPGDIRKGGEIVEKREDSLGINKRLRSCVW